MDTPEVTVLYLLKKDEAAYLKMKKIKPKSRKIVLKDWQVTVSEKLSILYLFIYNTPPWKFT